MDQETESLLLRRSLGRASPEDYIAWAVERLCQDCDTPALRILAGLNSQLDQDEIEHYFLLTRTELGIDDAPSARSPFATVRMIRRAYDARRAVPTEVVDMMAQVYESSAYQEELLAPWHNMREALLWREEYYYPLAALASIQQAVDREWLLLDRALALTLPQGWLRLVRCTECHRVGPVRVREPSVIAALWATLRRRRALSVVECERCRSTKITSLSDPDARAAYLEHLTRRDDGQQSRGASSPQYSGTGR